MSKEVEAAFRTVPRHLFTPGVTLEESYAQDTVRTKRDEFPHGIGRDVVYRCVDAAGWCALLC
ncbi:MAG: hypothetical protein ACRDTC_00030 [Pseudonocardiaceae bacterium]